MPATRVTSYETTDWTDLSTAPSAVTYNGNRSYSLTFSGKDYTGILSPGQRLRTTRTVAAPTQCTSLNGTNQYFNKTSPAGMTFTNNFVVSAWVKLSSYPSGDVGIVSRIDATQGWWFGLNSSGQLLLSGANGALGNFRRVVSYQSVPLNKWVHVAAQLDMATYTVSPTTCYVMIDGVDVPAYLLQNGTNPTSLVQAGNLQISGLNGASNLFSGKVAQAAIFNAKVTQANIRATISQGLAGNETSLISAYSFNNSINDLNTTNANNLTAQNSAVATNADSPFGGQAGGSISSTLDYGIIQSDTFSTDTTVVVQVPEGCTIPTSGGVTTVSYSALKAPYGIPINVDKWQIVIKHTQNTLKASSIANAWVAFTGSDFTIPVGSNIITTGLYITSESTTAATFNQQIQITNATPTAANTIPEREIQSKADSAVAYKVYKYMFNFPVNLSSATTFKIWGAMVGGSGTQNAYIEQGYVNYINITNAYL